MQEYTVAGSMIVSMQGEAEEDAFAQIDLTLEKAQAVAFVSAAASLLITLWAVFARIGIK